MDMIMNLFTGLGLSTAAGLNPYLPFLAVGVFARMELIQLNGPFAWLTHPLVLLIIAALAVLDFIGDKVPAVDHALHVAGVAIAPIAGAILALSANSGAGSVDPLLAGIAGLVVAGGTHAARATVRPAVTVATAGTGNSIVSLFEDIGAALLSVLAILMPILALLLAIALGVAAFFFFRKARGVWNKRKARTNGIYH